MRNRTRNRLLLLASLTACVAAVATLVGTLLLADSRSPGHWRIVVIPALIVWAALLWKVRRDQGEMDRVEASLHNAGVEIPDEEPIPIKLASDRESLVVSLIMLALITATFIAYYAGWFGSR